MRAQAPSRRRAARATRSGRATCGQRPAEPGSHAAEDEAPRSALTVWDQTPLLARTHYGEWLDDGISALDFAVTDLRGLSPVGLASPLAVPLVQRMPTRQ